MLQLPAIAFVGDFGLWLTSKPFWMMSSATVLRCTSRFGIFHVLICAGNLLNLTRR